MFDADRAILKSSQDRLNRAVFAKYLARCTLDHKDPDSLVVGLYGGWGVGKTSIINMVVEELNLAASNMLDDEKPIILNFSPWSYSGQNDLIYSFFRRLSSALRSTPFENSDRIIHLLELYVSFFTHKPIPKVLRQKHSLLDKFSLKKKQDVFGWESGRDLTLIKAELNELLRKRNHKIIIIIDNISRLYPAEIKQIIQIVKSMGDYANTAYLLALDKEQVIQALNTINGSGGEQLLEKVVQLPFEIPPILPQDLENIIADKLSQIIANVPEDTWNTGHWADIYYSSLKYFFENCRDITRYANALRFSYPRLHDLVNPVDFLALTAIEVFLPDVYYGIRDNKDLFTDLLDNVYVLNEKELEEDKSRCDEILARNKRFPHETLLELMMKLFPRIRHIYQPDISFYHSDSLARKLKRVCSPDVFDVYFRLSMQSGQILKSEFETLLALASDTEGFDQALTRLNQDGRIIKFLDLLDGKGLEKIPREHIPAIIQSLLDNGDLFPIGSPGLLTLDTPMRIHRIIHSLLQRILSPQTRFTIMETAITKTNKSLYSIIHELIQQGREHLENEDTHIPLEFRDFSPEQLILLRKKAVENIVIWANDGRLMDHPKLLPILFAWLDWGNEHACREYVADMTKSDRGLVAFLSATLSDAISQAITNYAKDPLWQKYLHDIEQFIPAKKLEEHTKILFEDDYFEKLREREQLAIMIFLDLIKADTKKVIPETGSN